MAPIWRRDFILLWLTGLCLSTAYYVMLPVLPLYLAHLGQDESHIGLLVAVMTFAATASRPFIGMALDRLGRRQPYLWSLALFAGVLALYGLVQALWLLVLLRVLHGLSWAGATTAGNTLAADLLPATRRGEGLGYYLLTLSAAMALGPGVSLWLLREGVSFAVVFAAAALLVVAAIILARCIAYPALAPPPEPSRLSWQSVFEPRVLGLSSTMFLVALTYGIIVTFVPLHAGRSVPGGAGVFYLVYAIMLALVRPFSGRILDRHGPGALVGGSMLLMAAGYVAMALLPTVFGMGLAALLIGTGSGVVLPAIGALVANRVEATHRGRASATYFIALDLGIGVGSILFGYVAQYLNMAAVFWCGALCSVLAAWHLWGWVMPRGQHQPIGANDETASV